jgi:transposase
MEGLTPRYRGSRARVTPAGVQARVRLKPHRLERYTASHDPEFESKAAESLVFILIRRSTRLPSVSTRRVPFRRSTARTRGCRFRRGGRSDRDWNIIAMGRCRCMRLNLKTGHVEGRTAARHTSIEFIQFLSRLLRRARWAREIHAIQDNLSADKSQAVEKFLEDNPKVKFHFTPTYSSWLNQVEIWFAKIQGDVIDRGIFTSVADLHGKLMRYIRAYGRVGKPIGWTFRDVNRRIRTNAIGGAAH